MQGERIVIDTWEALERIERAARDTPFCDCGEPTLAVGREGGVWLECRSLQTSRRSVLRRILSGEGLVHTRRLVLDLRPAAA
jgi:hypothetical protein